MSDQADMLRRRLEEHNGKRGKVIAVTSGKGGVGKSNFSINFAVGLAQERYRVLVIDFDIGMGNIHLLIGKSNRYTIADHFEKGVPLTDIIEQGPGGVHYIGGGTGLTQLLSLSDRLFERFSAEFEQILGRYDYILMDMGAGVSDQSLQFMIAANEVFIITTPEPTAITDAYSMMKFLTKQAADIPFYLICNRAPSYKNGEEVLTRLAGAAGKFLNKDVSRLGVIPDDSSVSRAVLRQVPFLELEPKARASTALKQLQQSYLGNENKGTGQELSFMSKVRGYLFIRQ